MRLTPAGAILLGVAGWLAYVLALEIRNPRLVASWHGFLHTAIANRPASGGMIPENPFFAGEPLPYYWFFHRIAGTLAGGFGIDPLSALRLLTLAGLVLLVITAVMVGWKVLRSAEAGLVIGLLALTGLNPLGPGIAAARHYTQGAELFERDSGGAAVETAFVSNEAADQLMSRNLLGRMYFSTDWRHGENITWFLDISSRGLALALIMLLVALTLRERPTAGRLAYTGLTAAMLAALNPIVGLAVAGFLGFSLLLVGGRSFRISVAALAAGVLLSVPTFYHLFTQGGQGASINAPGLIGLKLVNMAVNFVVLLPLALLAFRRRFGALGGPMRAIVLTGILLILAMVTVHLEEGNEHNLTNAAQVILAAPAVAAMLVRRDGTFQDRPGRRLALLALVFLPVAAGTWVAFDGRPPLPFRAAHGVLVRTPETDPLPMLYTWLKENTAENAIIVVDPETPVKMSGNVSELPAFTARTLFVDHPSYLTTPYPDRDRRVAIARSLIAGAVPGSEDQAYLWRVRRSGNPGGGRPRPLYLVSHAADRPGVLARLTAANGTPLFHREFVAVFQVPERSVLPARAP